MTNSSFVQLMPTIVCYICKKCELVCPDSPGDQLLFTALETLMLQMLLCCCRSSRAWQHYKRWKSRLFPAGQVTGTWKQTSLTCMKLYMLSWVTLRIMFVDLKHTCLLGSLAGKQGCVWHACLLLTFSLLSRGNIRVMWSHQAAVSSCWCHRCLLS